jgi:hypothetical protein
LLCGANGGVLLGKEEVMFTSAIRHHDKQSTDRAIHRAFAQLRARPRVRLAFARLLTVASDRSDLLRTRPDAHDRHASVDALRNLAAFNRAFQGVPERWGGADGHRIGVIASLARHLLGRYPTPYFLGSVWLGDDGAADRERRWWFVRHARGVPFRRVGVPMPLTRRMEHHFLRSPDHMPVLQALRRAEVLGLGGRLSLANAIAATRLGRTLDDPARWRATIELLVANVRDLDLDRLPRLVDYLAAFGDEPPRAPVAALLDASERWHARPPAGRIAWRKSRWPDFAWEPGTHGLGCDERWQLVELLDSRQLAAEGQAMSHCVATYARRCCFGRSTIWSLRREHAGETSSMLTIEIDPKGRVIVQIRGPHNDRRITPAHALLRAWAASERIAIMRDA